MKKILIFLLLSFVVISLKAQSYYTTRCYTYSHLVIQHPNDKIDYDDKAFGGIIFGVKNSHEVVGISLDREIMYQGFIDKKESSIENGLPVIAYRFTSNSHGIIVPIVLTEIYETSSSKEPFMFFLTVLNKYTNAPVRYNIFTEINRVKRNK